MYWLTSIIAGKAASRVHCSCSMIAGVGSRRNASAWCAACRAPATARSSARFSAARASQLLSSKCVDETFQYSSAACAQRSAFISELSATTHARGSK